MRPAQRLPLIDLLKVDRSFISDVTAAPESASVTRSIKRTGVFRCLRGRLTSIFCT